MSETVDIKEFAQRVERLCDFLLSKVTRDGSTDVGVLEDLKQDAADLQFKPEVITDVALVGLSDFMKGANVP